MNYLPEIMRTFDEIGRIMETEQITIEEMWDSAEKLLNEAFVQDQSETGAAIWESILRIVPKDTDSLEVRNFRISGRLNEDLPYTHRTLQRQLEALCGTEGVTLELDNALYTINVRVALTSKKLKDEVYSLVDREAPANLVLDIQLRYNTHAIIGGYTHNQLSNYTQEQLREEPIF